MTGLIHDVYHKLLKQSNAVVNCSSFLFTSVCVSATGLASEPACLFTHLFTYYNYIIICIIYYHMFHIETINIAIVDALPWIDPNRRG